METELTEPISIEKSWPFDGRFKRGQRLWFSQKARESISTDLNAPREELSPESVKGLETLSDQWDQSIVFVSLNNYSLKGLYSPYIYGNP